MRKEPKNPPPGMVRPPAPPAPPAKQTDTKLAAENRSLRKTIANYIMARNDYEDAIRKPNSHAPMRVLSHGDPRILRWLNAREALASTVACGSCGALIQADEMTGTKCSCARMIPNNREGKIALTKAGALAVLARTRQFSPGRGSSSAARMTIGTGMTANRLIRVHWTLRLKP